MFIAKVENNQVIKVVDYREVFGRSVPTDEQVESQGYMRVNLFVDHDALTQKLIPAEPVIRDGWVYTMAVADMTSEEVQAAKDSAMANIRAQRNQMLSATDWRYRRDLTTTADWDAYCQALRDLPATIVASGQDPRTFTNWPRDPNWVDITNLA
jgi:Phage tail assembly chaperone protein